MQQKGKATPSLLCIAAPQDVSALASWEKHLLPLQQAGRLSVWSERTLPPGSGRQEQFLRHLAQATVVIFLLSADFFANEECCTWMDYILQYSRTLKVLPLLVRPVVWRESPLGALPCLPANALPVKVWSDEDEGWHACVQDLQRLLRITSPRITPGKRDRGDRSKFLRLLRRDYQKDLDESLERLAWLELGLYERPDAVRNATRLSQLCLDQTERALPAGTSLLQVYEEAAEALLILGEPGAGKSTLLTRLALDLLTQAEANPTSPIPVILLLSSWAEKKLPLADWLIEQIAVRYDVPRHLGKTWLQQQQLLPLLDGLDEMEEAARVQCIAVVNAYRKATFSSLVVCSRTGEYQDASVRQRLALQQAVVVQPLTQEQVGQMVLQGGAALAALDQALQESKELQELATTPLMLSILILTYHRKCLPELPQQSRELERLVWEQYIERMLAEKGATREGAGDRLLRRYDRVQTCSWLIWLAQQMRAHNQTAFSGEYLQESWLPSALLPRAIWLVEIFPAILLGAATAISLSFILLNLGSFKSFAEACQVGLIGGFLGWCLCSGSHFPFWSWQRRSLLASGCLALFSAASLGLNLGAPSLQLSSGAIFYYDVSDWIHDGIIVASSLLFSGWLLQWVFSPRVPRFAFSNPGPVSRWNRFSRWLQTSSLRRALWTVAILGLYYGLGNGLTYWWGYRGIDWLIYDGLLAVRFFGLLFGVTTFLLSTILDGNQRTIRLAEQISWTWRAFLQVRHLRASLFVLLTLVCFFGLIYGLLSGLSNGLLSGLLSGLLWGLLSGLSNGLLWGLLGGLIYWLLLGFYQGVTQNHLEDRDRRRFNQGLHRSLRNSLLLSFLGSGILTGVSIPLWGLLYGPIDSWILFPFLCIWIVLWMAMGGLTIVRHYTLRLLLARSHTFPLHARRFLDDTVARTLLKRQGGGYAFVHRRLLDHFADASSWTATELPAREAEQQPVPTTRLASFEGSH